MSDAVAEAVGRGDLDELVRLVDGLAGSREWPEIVRLRDRCRLAMERGLQLWPAAEYAEYRLALDAPAEFAGPVVREGSGRFSLGPLWEVAASTHDWASLAPHLADGPMRAMAAHERVLRGEDLTGETGIDSLVLEVPLRLEPWEPEYPLASYRPDEADFPAPDLPHFHLAGMGGPGAEIDDEESVEALYDLGRIWAEHSNGAVETAAVEGGAAAAVARLGFPEARISRIDPAAAMAWMAWAAANGGAYGRRRGGPAGRFAAWWTAAMLAGFDWPPDPGELGEAIAGLEWHLWEPPGLVGGWSLHLAAADPGEGVAWAVAATDTHRDDDPDRPDGPE